MNYMSEIYYHESPKYGIPFFINISFKHAYQTIQCSTSGWIWKTTALRRKSKIGKCQVTAYGFLRLLYNAESILIRLYLLLREK